MTETTTWTPSERRAYLDTLVDQPDTGGICRQVADAERLAEVTMRDWAEAGDVLRYARAAAPDADLAHDRALSPDDRHAVCELYSAEEAEARAADAYYRARDKRDRLVAEFDSLSLSR